MFLQRATEGKTVMQTRNTSAQMAVMAIAGLLAVWTSCVDVAFAETVNCTAITSLPYTISSPGSYCLTGNLATAITTGSAIAINASNVVLDLNGFALTGFGAGLATEASGVYSVNRENITIRNGTIGGFYRGIFLDHNTSTARVPPRSQVVEDIRADRNRLYGIQAIGAGHIIRKNCIMETGGTPTPATGIYTFGQDSRVIDNDVILRPSTNEPGIWDTGILVVTAPFSNVYRQLVVNNRVGTLGIYQKGIEVIGAVIRGNLVYGVSGSALSYTGAYLNAGGNYPLP